jgi:vancomycin aglycone glucosyltransferase
VTQFIEAQYDTLTVAAKDCDVLVATGMSHFAARSVAEQAGIPYRYAMFSPSALDAPIRDARLDGPVNAHRESIGLPPVDLLEFVFTDHPWVAADPVLSPWPDPPGITIVRTGAWILPDERPLADELEAFLAAGSPPVYVGFGSMAMGDTKELARVAVEAVRALGRRAVVSRGRAGLALVDDRDDCLAVGEVSQQALFGRVAAVVHHGGAGTTTAAARAGAPQVIVPQAADQPYWASRVADLGIGVAHDGPVPTASSLSAALETVLKPQTRARAIAVAGTISTDGAAVAARRLLHETDETNETAEVRG